MNILADASLPGLTAAFPEPFKLTTYSDPAEISRLITHQEVLFCRSTLKVNAALLHKSEIKYVATASSGTDHIDALFLNSANITLIDAKGCNAPSVADYVLACMAYLELNTHVYGKKVGVIGMGFVGCEVHSRLSAKGFNLCAYDPLKEHREPAFTSCPIDALYDCDVLCVHAELHANTPFPSVNLLNAEMLSKLKPGCVIINAARGGIVNEEDLLANQRHLIYCTDVYNNEPRPDKRIIDQALLCTPHIAGHSLEGKYAAVAIISSKLHRIAGLPVPVFATPVLEERVMPVKSSSWQEFILSLYNPADETKALKDAIDKEHAFITLRKKHQHRHDFSVYVE